MSSGYSPRWRRVLHRFAPFLFRVCSSRNYHWRGDRACYCSGDAKKLRAGDSREWMLAEQRDRWRNYACKWESERHLYYRTLEEVYDLVLRINTDVDKPSAGQDGADQRAALQLITTVLADRAQQPKIATASAPSHGAQRSDDEPRKAQRS